MRRLEHIINTLDKHRLAGLQAHLLEFVNANRVALIDRVLDQRTRFLTVALENVYQSHNASAVVRSCECFGVQDVHVLECGNRFEPAGSVAQGAARWVTVHRHRGPDATSDGLQALKDSGYRLVAMSPAPGCTPLEDLPVEAPLALCIGSEEPGLSKQAVAMADLSATVPMHGFTRSLNLSVTTAIALERLSSRVRRSRVDWGLDPVEREYLRTLWLARSTAAGHRIVVRHLGSKVD